MVMVEADDGTLVEGALVGTELVGSPVGLVLGARLGFSDGLFENGAPVGTNVAPTTVGPWVFGAAVGLNGSGVGVPDVGANTGAGAEVTGAPVGEAVGEGEAGDLVGENVSFWAVG